MKKASEKIKEELFIAIEKIELNMSTKDDWKFGGEANQALNSCTDPSAARDKFVYWMLGGDQSEPTPFNRPDLLEMTAEVRELYRRRIAGKRVLKKEWETAKNNALEMADKMAIIEKNIQNMLLCLRLMLLSIKKYG